MDATAKERRADSASVLKQTNCASDLMMQSTPAPQFTLIPIEVGATNGLTQQH